MSLESAPDHVKLAVDLIALLEENNINNNTAIAALKIVLQDCERKQSIANSPRNGPSDQHS
ncbi:DUF2496 domain-containing protein [Marinomonas piezotolerans]|uniref:DUF2496 domain-containing protein n=1 Tax=Marinomonas piezotolerans TaxID=2213058 RepID=A0A370U6L2_9GAMM|nr:DUF2496 domain-containing protein [Marinomonas piezotolerans]RDL43409.1 DUF2496 domain-containing protein [Marinomonas piezotolerans]